MATAAPNGDVPPQPKVILRGHKAQVHAAAFIRAKERLLTGDADGFIVAWDLTIMRPRAVWQAHDNAILGVAGWELDKVITHGRDNKLIVWKLAVEDEVSMSTVLPLDPSSEPRMKPWMLHMLEVNTMNFCSFAVSSALAPDAATPGPELTEAAPSGLIIAVPNTLASEAVDIYHLPSQNRIHTVRLGGDHGMAMALTLAWLGGALTLIIGYEDGVCIVARLEEDASWSIVYRNQCHKQPILSLDVAPNQEYFLTSSADATIAKHPLKDLQSPSQASSAGDAAETHIQNNEANTSIASDQRSSQSTNNAKPVSLLSAALAAQPPVEIPRAAKRPEVQTQPLKVVNTKHAGQQGLTVRSDGRIFATAGWDSMIRVYSAKTMREVAVLKWHPVGCFAVAFAETSPAEPTGASPPQRKADDGNESSSKKLVSRVLDVTVRDRRILQAKNAHWLAAGSKDGKVSLWDVF